VSRSLPHRLTALLAAVFFLFSWTGEALGQHACPHHSQVPGAAAHAAAEHGHAGHGRHAAEAAGHDHGWPAAPAAEHGACTCQGTCPSAAADAPPVAGDASLRVAPASVREARPDDRAAVPARLAPFFLPYGQAPPVLG
jgi:hypothetical protein